MHALLEDLRYGVRSLLKRPGVTLMAIASLGIGIGVTTTAFSLLNAMALRDFPGIRGQDRLVTLGLGVEDDARRVPSILLSWADVEILRNRTELFEGVAGSGFVEVALSTGGEPVMAMAEVVSGNYFSVLGTRPFRGRLLNEGDEAEGEASVVLAHRVYERLGAPSDIVGRRVELNGQPFTVVGVAPPNYTGMVPGDVVDREASGPAVWVPLSRASSIRPSWLEGDVFTADARWLRVVARRADGVGMDRLETGLPLAARALEAGLPGERQGATLVAGDLRFGPGAGPWRLVLTISAFMVVPLLVLLIACANAANLLLARTTERRRELAVRSALGAGRGALVRQVLAESVVLAVAAGVLGLMVAYWSRSIAELYAVRLSMEAPVDLRVFLFAFAAAIGAGILLGLAPALGAARTEPARALAGSSRSSDTRGAARLRRLLVVGQVALSVILLVAAGLFVRSAQHGLSISTGIEEEGLILATLDLGVLQYEESEGRAFYQALVEGARGLPSVEAAGLADLPPLDGLPAGRVARPDQEAAYGVRAGFSYVGEGWFEAAGVPVLSGRPPRRVEAAGSEVVISRALAKELWPGASPLGEPLQVGTGEDVRTLTVVGVAGDARTRLHEAPAPVVYRPREGSYLSTATVYIRSDRTEAATRGVRELVRRLDPRLPIRSVETAAELRERELLPWRLMAMALGSLGGIGLLLAVAGLYGVVAFSVARRTREIGIRIAMGSDRQGVVRLVVREAVALVGTGLLVGALVAALIATLLESMLFGVSPVDPWTYGTLAVLLLAVGVLAALVPGRRAAAVEPMRALAD